MVETVKCPLCDQEYEKGTDHQCGERQKFAQEVSKTGEGLLVVFLPFAML